MPRFYFNIHDGVDINDTEGMECENWTAARLAAIHYAGAILASETTRVASGEDWHMDVTDDTGLILFRLAVHLSDTLPIKPSRRAINDVLQTENSRSSQGLPSMRNRKH